MIGETLPQAREVKARQDYFIGSKTITPEGTVYTETTRQRLITDILNNLHTMDEVTQAVLQSLCSRLQIYTFIKDLETDNRVKNLITELVLQKDVNAAFIASRREPKIWMDINGIIKQTVATSSTEVDLTLEIAKALQAIWQHEREHLYRFANPRTRNIDRQFRTKGSLYSLGGAGLMTIACTGIVALSGGDHNHPINLILTSIASYGATLAGAELRYKYEPGEKAANEAMKNLDSTNNPFSVRISPNLDL